MSTLKKEIVIRVAALDDAEELLEIYAPYLSGKLQLHLNMKFPP